MMPADMNCPPPVIERIRTADLASDENDMLFSWVAENSDLACQLDAVAAVAARLDSASHTAVVGDFCGSVATYARLLPPETIEAVRAAYLRFRYDPSIHAYYFMGLRHAGIDIRAVLRGRIAEDWRFAHPGLDAETWHYTLYLASLGEQSAYDALAAKIAATASGNDVTNLLRSLAELKTPEAKAILLDYADDQRRAEGTEGPEMTVAETVAILTSVF